MYETLHSVREIKLIGEHMPSLNVGDKASRTTLITDEMIYAFADLTGDTNPVHLDDAYAAGTRFGRRIAHGMIAAGLISAALANDLPGPGTVYLSQTLQFKAPVYPGDTITTTVEVMVSPVETGALNCSVRLDRKSTHL